MSSAPIFLDHDDVAKNSRNGRAAAPIFPSCSESGVSIMIQSLYQLIQPLLAGGVAGGVTTGLGAGPPVGGGAGGVGASAWAGGTRPTSSYQSVLTMPPPRSLTPCARSLVYSVGALPESRIARDMSREVPFSMARSFWELCQIAIPMPWQLSGLTRNRASVSPCDSSVLCIGVRTSLMCL